MVNLLTNNQPEVENGIDEPEDLNLADDLSGKVNIFFHYYYLDENSVILYIFINTYFILYII